MTSEQDVCATRTLRKRTTKSLICTFGILPLESKSLQSALILHPSFFQLTGECLNLQKLEESENPQPRFGP